MFCRPRGASRASAVVAAALGALHVMWEDPPRSGRYGRPGGKVGASLSLRTAMHDIGLQAVARPARAKSCPGCLHDLALARDLPVIQKLIDSNVESGRSVAPCNPGSSSAPTPVGAGQTHLHQQVIQPLHGYDQKIVRARRPRPSRTGSSTRSAWVPIWIPCTGLQPDKGRLISRGPGAVQPDHGPLHGDWVGQLESLQSSIIRWAATPGREHSVQIRAWGGAARIQGQ